MRLSRRLAIIVATSIALVTIPSAIGLYYYYKDKLLDKETVALQAETDTNISNAFRPIRLEAARLNFLSQLLQKDLASAPESNDIKLFDNMMQRSADGAWRNRSNEKEADRSAGVFLPPEIKLDAKQKSLHVRTKKIIDAAAFGLNSYFTNLWLLTHDKTEVISDSLTPDFILQMPADTDYTKTAWMTLGDPVTNPLREMRWTEPSYDPVPKTWLISGVKPVDVNGVWIGNIGQDMFMQNMFAILFKKTQRYRGEQYFLLDIHGHYLQAGPWQQALEVNPEKFSVDFSQAPLLEKLFKQKLKNSAQVFGQQVSIKDQKYLAISTMIMPMDWRYYRLVPVSEILAPLNKLFITMGIALVLMGLLIGTLIHQAIQDIVLNRIRTLARKVYVPETKSFAPVTSLSLVKNTDATLNLKPEIDDDINLAAQGFDIALKQLQESERELQILMDNIPGTVARVNRELRYEFANKQHELVYGKRLKWVLSHTMPELLGEDLFAHAEPYVKKVLAGEASSYECAIKVPSGETIIGLVHLVPNLDEHNNVKGFFILGLDISELKQSQVVVAASQSLLKTIIDITPVQIYWKDIESRYLGANMAFALDANLKSPDELIGKLDTDLLWGHNAAQYQAEDRVVIESGKPLINYEHVLARPNGQVTWAKSSKVPLRNRIGEIIGVLGVDEDITDIKAKEQEIQDSRNLLITILDNAPIRIFWKDIHSNYLGFNAAFARDAGLEHPEELIGRSDDVCSWSNLAEKYIADDNLVMETGIARLDFEEQVPWPEGQISWLKESTLPLRNQDGDVIGVLGIYDDITERKLLEQARLEVQERFEKIAINIPGIVYQFLWRPDGTSCFPFVSEGMHYIFRLSPEEVREDASKAFAMIHPNDYDDLVTSIEISAKDLTLWQEEFRVRYEDGTMRWLFGKSLPEKQENGDVLWHGFITDITVQKQLDLELESKKTLLEAQLDATIDGVLVVDKHDKIVSINQRFLEMFSFPQDFIKQTDDKHLLENVVSIIKYPDQFLQKVKYLYEHINEYSIDEIELNNGKAFERYSAPVLGRNGIHYGRIWTFHDITNRKLAQQALIDSEYRWKFAIEGSGDGVWDVNVQTHEATYSKRWKEMLGFDENDKLISRKEWIKRIHPQDKARVLAAGDAYLEGRADSYVVEYRLKCKDGEYKWMQSRGMLVSRDEAGKPLRMIGTQTDITERINAQAALQKTKEELELSLDRFKDLYEFAPIGYLTLNKHGLISQLNWRASAMLGMDRRALIDKRIAEFIDEDDKLRWSRMYQDIKALEVGEELSFDMKFRLSNSNTFHGNLNCLKVPDTDGQSMLRIALEDITTIKKSEDESRIAAIAFETNEGILITDADRTILKANKAFTNITGYTDAELVGKHPRIFNSGRHDAAFFDAKWETINKLGQWSGEIWKRRKNGELYPEKLTITAVKTNKGIVTNYVYAATDISFIKAAADEIQQLAFFDSLTHLPNRRLLMDRLKQAIASSVRSGRQGAVLFLDLDHFKVLNDSRGHDVGDLLLQQVADRLTLCVREGDTVARLGGDEYVVVLEDLSEVGLETAALTETIAKKIVEALNQPYQLGEYEHHSTPSIGISIFGEQAITIEELLKQADIAMYQAKKAGRNTMRFFNPQMQTSITARVSLERELRKAIDKKQLELYYQIQVDNVGHQLGAEALIRWIHPERGLVSPAQFIPLAEETGLILPIGNWVLDAACAQIKAWHKNAKTRDLTLSINVSAKQFRQVDFVAQVKSAIERHSIDPMQLKLELTESLLLENIEETIQSMSALGELGVQFSLDDFGTGYSSLQYLKKLPLYQLKIDQSFVRDIVTDSHDRSIVRTIIAMAQSLYLNVIAEGVETEQQRELLLSHGCKRYQGYLFGKPVPIKEFNTALKALPRNDY